MICNGNVCSQLQGDYCSTLATVVMHSCLSILQCRIIHSWQQARQTRTDVFCYTQMVMLLSREAERLPIL